MTPRRSRGVIAAAAVACLLVAACSSGRSGALVEDESGSSAADYVYLIPPGTGDRVTAGEDVEILPAELDVQVGEVIRIVNDDTQGHFVGIFYVGAGETVTQRFSSAGQYTGQCSVHPSGELVLRIHE